MENSKKTTRNSNLELLRIICMMMIIGWHYIQHGGGESPSMLFSTFSVNHVFATIFGSWGQLGVSGFVIISCYFMRENASFKAKRIFSLVLEVFVYCLLFTIIGLLTGEVGMKDIVKELLSPFYSQYWFITTYIVFSFIAPFLKIITDKLSVQSLKRFCIVLTICIPFYNLFWTNMGNYLADFIYIFCVVSYLKQRENNFFERHARTGFVILTWILIIISVCICMLGTITGMDMVLKLTKQLVDRNILIVIDALFLFYTFKSFKIPSSKLINIFGKATFGVYIIHENVLFRGEGEPSLLWDRFLNVFGAYEMWYFPLHMALSIVGVFFVCAIIEIVRIKIMDELLLPKITVIDSLCGKFEKWYLPKI